MRDSPDLPAPGRAVGIGLAALVVAAGTLALAIHLLRDGGGPPAPEEGPALAAPEPGRVSTRILSVSGVAFADGEWYLVDARRSRIHVLGPDGEYRRGFGRKGKGPGEFRAPLAIAVAGGRVAVSEALSDRLRLLSGSGKPLRSIRTETDDCTGGFAVRLAHLRGTILGLHRCIDSREGIGYRVRRLDVDGGEPVWLGPRLEERVRPDRTVPLQAPVLAADEARGNFYFGDGRSGCVGVYDASGRERDRICLEGFERVTLDPATRERWQRTVNRPGSPLSIAIPERLPLFDHVAATPRGPAFRVIRGTDRHEWVIPRSDGPPIVVPVPRDARSFLSGDRLLVAVERLEGMEIHIEEIEEIEEMEETDEERQGA